MDDEDVSLDLINMWQIISSKHASRRYNRQRYDLTPGSCQSELFLVKAVLLTKKSAASRFREVSQFSEDVEVFAGVAARTADEAIFTVVVVPIRDTSLGKNDMRPATPVVAAP